MTSSTYLKSKTIWTSVRSDISSCYCDYKMKKQKKNYSKIFEIFICFLHYANLSLIEKPTKTNSGQKSFYTNKKIKKKNAN